MDRQPDRRMKVTCKKKRWMTKEKMNDRLEVERWMKKKEKKSEYITENRSGQSR